MMPEKINRYEILRELGRGGMASVFLARDPNFDRQVAIKLLPREFLHDKSFQKRFQQEAKTIAALEHPAIVPVYDFGEHEGQPYLVMRYMSGDSLGTRKKKGPLTTDEIRHTLQQLASALDYAHGQMVVHRDLKPDNILFDEFGNAFLSDFGIAKLRESTAALTGSSIIGTPAYMSPEQAQGEGEIDGRSDLYSLGIVLFEALTGRLPFEADTPVRQLMMHVNQSPPDLRSINRGLPEDLNAVLQKLLAKEPDERYQSAQALYNDFEETLWGASPGPAPEIMETTVEAQKEDEIPTEVVAPAPAAAPIIKSPPPVTAGKRPNRSVKLVGGMAVILLLAVVGVFIFLNLDFSTLFAAPPEGVEPDAAAVEAAPTATRAAPSPPPAENVAPGPELLFVDDFEAPLDGAWTWVREEPNRWSLSNAPGFMQILLQPDGLGGGFPRNLLLLEAPEGEFEIETRLVFEPRSNYQIAALVIYQDDGNALQFGRAYCDGQAVCVGDGLYFDKLQGGSTAGENFATALPDTTAIYIKLHRKGARFTAFFSEDGDTWQRIGEHTSTLSVDSIGLVAGQSNESAVYAEFDYFRVYQLP